MPFLRLPHDEISDFFGMDRHAEEGFCNGEMEKAVVLIIAHLQRKHSRSIIASASPESKAE